MRDDSSVFQCTDHLEYVGNYRSANNGFIAFMVSASRMSSISFRVTQIASLQNLLLTLGAPAKMWAFKINSYKSYY